jgi:Tol biopolymer transport system component/DNA-binding winged helix-turn-helix (wHTH) protein
MRALYRFDDVVLDLEAFRLTRSGQPVHLEPKVLELLGYLVSNRGRLVEKPELQAAIWSDTVVSDSALTRAVAQLRKALEDDAREARYVETVPTRGYRFRPEVDVVEGRNGAPSPSGGPGAEAAGGSDGSEPPRRRLGPGRAVAVAVGLAVLAAAAMVMVRQRASSTAPAPREAFRTLVSTTRGFSGFPTFSPDGGTLAFASDRSGRFEIFARALAPGAREVPLTADGQDNVQPAWSPDGRYIAYHSILRGGLWLMPALGGTPRQISELGSAPAWSPDGTKLAFSSLGLAALDGISQYGSCLWIADVAGGDLLRPRRLTEPGRPGSGHGPPVFSSDGRDVLFVSEGIWAVRSDGSELPRQILAGGAMEAAVAPDGKNLYWSGWEKNNWRVWQAPLRPGVAGIGPVSELLNTGDQAARHLTVSRDGRLAFGLLSLVSDIALLSVGPDGSPTGAPREPMPGASGRKRLLHFSRDGQRLGFARSQAGQGLEVWGLDLRSGAARTLLPGAEVGFFNGWFPGDEALFVTSRATKTLMRAPLSGGRAESLPPAEAIGWPRLLPSGQEFVYHSVSNGALNVHRMRTGGGSARQLTDDAQGVGWPVPSPDGRTLAVEAFRGNDTQLGLLPAEGGTARLVTRVPGQHWGHDWSPDGRKVLFAGRRDGLWNVYWIDVETGEERRLTDQGRVRDVVRTPAWSSRGDTVAYERLQAESAVWVLELAVPGR